MLKHRIIGRSAVFLAVVATGVLALAGAASAANPLPHYGKTGVAGYEYTSPTALNNLTLVVTPGTTFANIGNVGVGGAGGQFCDPNNGYAAQEGIVATSATTESVDYQAGVLGGCADFGVLQSPLQVNAALTNIPLGDSVQIWMSHHTETTRTRHPGHWTSCKRHGKTVKDCHWHKAYYTSKTATVILFQAQDVTSGSEVFSKTITAPGVEYFDSTGVGVQQDTTGMSACDPLAGNSNVWDLPAGTTLTAAGAKDGTCQPNDVVHFSDLWANGIDLFKAASPGQEWVTSAGGLTSNPVLVGPNKITPGGFAIYAGNATV